jgi:hypothetical protein
LSITGSPLTWCFSISRIATKTLVSGETEMTRLVITSDTFMMLSKRALKVLACRLNFGLLR